MPDDQLNTVGDNGVDTQATETVTPDSQPQDGGVTPDIQSWKEENKVPYSRFEEVVRANQEFRDGFTQKLDAIMEQLNNSKQPTPDTTGQESEWDQMAKNAKNWGEFGKWMEERLFQKFESVQKSKQEEAQQQLDSEIRSLYSSGLVKSKDEENAVLNFAVKKSEELKQSIPLSVAARWYQETATKTDNKEAAGKILSPSKSSGGPGSSTSYKDIRSKGLDEIVLEAKLNAPKG